MLRFVTINLKRNEMSQSQVISKGWNILLHSIENVISLKYLFQLEKAQFKLRHWSWWMTVISTIGEIYFFNTPCIKTILALIITIANSSLTFGKYNYYYYIYVMQGFYGSLYGIIAGPIGIRLSYVKQVRQMKCLWIAFIILVGYI